MRRRGRPRAPAATTPPAAPAHQLRHVSARWSAARQRLRRPATTQPVPTSCSPLNAASTLACAAHERASPAPDSAGARSSGSGAATCSGDARSRIAGPARDDGEPAPPSTRRQYSCRSASGRSMRLPLSGVSSSVAGLPPHREFGGHLAALHEEGIRLERAIRRRDVTSVVHEAADAEVTPEPMTMRSDLNAPSSCEWHCTTLPALSAQSVADGDEHPLGDEAAVVEEPAADPHAERPPDQALNGCR